MKIIDPSYTILRPQELTPSTVAAIYSAIATAARTCYQSTGDNDAQLVKRLIASGHDAMLEHATMTVCFTVDRGVSHELVRHRLASYAQESTRYCSYDRAKFDGEITVIKPCGINKYAYLRWMELCEDAESAYMEMLQLETTPEIARSVLPHSLKTDVVMTANMREWRHFFRLRALGTTGWPHPQMVQVAMPLLKECAEAMPELFGDLMEGEKHGQEIKSDPGDGV